MYLRTVKAQGHDYLRLVESFRQDGKTKQRVIINLGRKDLLAPHLESLVRVLGGDGWVRGAEVNANEAARWGTVLAIRHLWRMLGVGTVIRDAAGKIGVRGKSDGASLEERAFVLVSNRLCAPGSEHHLAGWLETDYVCDADGRRWLPEWEEHGRVQVNLSWLQRWYRTLDKLAQRKEAIEGGLFLRLRDLFSLQAELVFYDLTSTYFEGDGPHELGEHGYSRDGKPRDRQVQVGVVMVNGWPIAHHVFAGGRREATTVPGVIDDLERRFGLKRVVFVGDRGMVTSDNLALLRQRKQGYLVGLQRRRREDIYELINRATAAPSGWQECPGGPESSRARRRTLVQEVAGDKPGVRVFVVSSDERLAYERGMREQSMERTRKELEKLKLRVDRGKLTAPEKIGAAAAKALARNHGHRYYGWELSQNQFRYFEHPNLERERAYEGKYLIQTEEQGLTPVEAVTAYKELSEVERAFRCLKDVIEMRPIYHRDDARVQGHIFVAMLAFLLKRALDKKLKAAGSHLSGEAALEALSTIHVVQMQVGPERRQGVTAGSSRAREVLRALGITVTNPPALSETT